MKDYFVFLYGIENEIEALKDWNRLQGNDCSYLRPSHGKIIPETFLFKLCFILKTYVEVTFSAVLCLFLIIFCGGRKIPKHDGYFFYRKKRFKVFEQLSCVKAYSFCHSLNFVSIHKEHLWNNHIIFFLSRFSVVEIVLKSIVLNMKIILSILRGKWRFSDFCLGMPVLGRCIEFYVTEEMFKILPKNIEFYTEEWLMRQGVWFTIFCNRYDHKCTIFQHGALQERYLPHHLCFYKFICYPCSKDLFFRDYGNAEKHIETWELLDLLKTTQKYVSCHQGNKDNMFYIGFASQGMHTERSIELLVLLQQQLYNINSTRMFKIFIYPHPNEPLEAFSSIVEDGLGNFELAKDRHYDLNLIITQYSTIALEYYKYHKNVKCIAYPPRGINMDFFSLDGVLVCKTEQCFIKKLSYFLEN